MIDLERYLQRIGARSTADLGTLLDRHMIAIPFENLDVILGRPPKLDLPALEAKLVGARRGGYCYEHATLFGAALDQLGYKVRRHSARVTMLRRREEAPRTHMFLTVAMPEGNVAVDPGFGGHGPRLPVRLDGTPAGIHRIEREGSFYTLYAGDKPLWVSTLEHDYPVDFEMANHFTATHTMSPFTQGLIMRAYTADGQITIRNRTVSRSSTEPPVELATGAELRAIVRESFGFDLPELDNLVLPASP